MKTMNQLTKMFSLGILMLSAIVAFSNNTPAREKNGGETVTEKTIHDYFKFPSVLIPHSNELKLTSQKVEVLFTTDRNGSVNFVLAKTQNIQLKIEIEKQFSSLRFGKLKSDVVHSVVLNFKTL